MGNHWSEDYVQHLRSAYFALVLVCVASIAISFSHSETPISTAHEQLDQIWELATSWNPAFLQAPAITAGDSGLVEYPDAPIAVTVDSDRFTVAFRLRPHLPFATLNTSRRPKQIRRSDCSQELPGHRPQDVLGDIIPTPGNVEEFAEDWDALFYGATLHQPARTGPLFVRKSDEAPFTAAPFSYSVTTRAEGNVSLYLRCLVPSSLKAIRNVNSDVSLPYQLHAAVTAPKYELYFPLMEMQDSAVDAQGLLFSGRPGKWHHGLFKDSFRDLNRVLGANKPRTWPEAVTLVTNDETTWHPSESFEALGIKFPASASLGWCIVVVLTLQLYLWVQLYEFKKKLGVDDPGWEVAWVGMYRSLPARLSFRVSIVIPVLAVVALGGRRLLLHNGQPWAWPWLILEVCVAGTLTIATYLVLPRMDPEPGVSAAD